MQIPADIRRRDDARMRSADRVAQMDAQRLGSTKPHGTRMRYVAGCKCLPCRAANSNYETMRAAARKAGEWNGIVPADAARAHIKRLSRLGVGRRAVADTSGVAFSILHEVKTGKRLNIRKSTEKAILAVDVSCAADRAHIPAAATWKKIDELLGEGFTKTELARRLGSKARVPSIQLKRDRVTAANAAKVDKLYRTVMAE